MTKGRGSTCIGRVEAWKCVIPLPEPFPLGNTVVAQRDYVVVRLVTEGGIEGVAYGLSRGAPVDHVVTELLAPHVLGQDATSTTTLTGSLAASLPHHGLEGLVQRALSLIDIAAWDIKGKVLGEPVWRLLGGDRVNAPILLVEGYPVPGEDDEGFGDRLRRRAAEGYSALKIEASTADQDALSRRLEVARDAVGDMSELIVDLAYTWTGHNDAIERAGNWLGPGLAWVEDPLHGNDVEGLRRIHPALPVPLAAGDEVTNPQSLRALVDARAVDVLRIDITCIGGITGFGPLYRAAADAGLRISTHVYPELHRHVVLGYPRSGQVEMFPDTGLWDATGRFIQPPSVQPDSQGVMVVDPPTEPGLGLVVDWAAVQTFSVRHHVVASDSVRPEAAP